jgi:von Willebrand factor type A domain
VKGRFGRRAALAGGSRVAFALASRAAFAVMAIAAWGWAPGCGSQPPGLVGDDGIGEGGAGGDDSGIPSGGFGSDANTAVAPPLGDAGCATASAQAKRQPVYLMFVLDGSDSMAQDNKWAAVVPALTSIFGEMKTAADPGVAAGLIIFPDKGGPFPSASDVPLAFVDATQNTALATRLMAGLALGTPTEAALTGGYTELEGFQPKAPLLTGGKKVVILITDGVPTDGCSMVLGLGNYAKNPCVTTAADKLVETAAKGGPIETFVVGVGDFPSTSTTDFDPAFLGNVAQSGGTGPSGCNPSEASSTSDLCYFEIDPSKSQTASDLQQKFETALDAIRGQVVSCTFPLQSTGLGQVDPTHVNVEVGGVTILQDPKNGWTYDNPTAPTSIILHGTACSTAETVVSATVNILLGCATEAIK